MLRLAGSLVLFVMISGSTALAEPPTFEEIFEKLDVAFDPPKARPGQTVKLKITPSFNKDWHTYPTVQPDPMAAGTVNSFRRSGEAASSLKTPDSVIDPPGQFPATELPKGTKEIRQYHSGITFVQPVVVSRDAKAGEQSLQATFIFLVCEQICHRKKMPIEAKLLVEGEPLSEVESKAEHDRLVKEWSKDASAVAPSTPKKETPSRNVEPNPVDRDPPILLDPNSDPKRDSICRLDPGKAKRGAPADYGHFS